MIDLFENVSLYINRRMCIKVIKVCQCLMDDVPDKLKTQETYIKVVDCNPWQLKYVPNQLKTQGTYERAAEESPRLLKYVLDHLKRRRFVKKRLRKNHVIGICTRPP